MAKTKKKSAGRTRANGEGTIWTDPKTGDLYAVITWTATVNGKSIRKRRARRAVNKTDAYEKIKELQKEITLERNLSVDNGDDPGPDKPVNPARLTVGELAEHHKSTNLTPAVFDDEGIKRSGVISWQDARGKIDALVRYFGANTLVKSITLGSIKTFRRVRLESPALAVHYKKDKVTGARIRIEKSRTDPKTGKQRKLSIASAHRDLEALRRMLNYAVEEGWLPTGNPMAGRKGLINSGEEKKRTTIASQAAETKLIEQCDEHARRRHLKPYLMTAFDHGCRSIELRRLLVQDVDFRANTFRVYSYKGKRRIDRLLTMTPRVRVALLECCADKKPEEHVFTYGKAKQPLKYAPKRSFATAKRLAQSDDQIDLSGFRAHDMRHTNITRLIKSGMPLDEAGALAGHMQPSTTARYLNPDSYSRQRAADLIANYNEANVIDLSAVVTAKRKRKKTA